MDSTGRPGLTYRDAGVDIDRGDRLVERIKPLAAATHRDGVLTGIGGFGALFELAPGRYRHPVLVSGTDGVGTKLRLAIESGRHDTIGVDLVAMCANDVLVVGAEPLYFLDYYATGRLDEAVAASVIEGIAEGCRRAGAALVGGETAEMPGMYAPGDYDLAGFCVGVVEKDAIIDGRHIAPGDCLIGVASSGPHSNGYSLIRRVLEVSGARLDDEFHGHSLGETLLAPTRIYVRPVLDLLARVEVRGIAHITGGGLLENVPRVLPAGTLARIQRDGWQRPPVFDWLAEHGGIDEQEMYRTFNCGIGLVLCVPAAAADAALSVLADLGETAWRIGGIESGEGKAHVVLS